MMYYNEGYPSDISPLMPQGTNSTFFTQCCGTAICDNEANCPSCKRPVVGHDAPAGHKRFMIRWANATRFWERK